MEDRFSKEQLKTSPDFLDYQDVIEVVLDKDTLYSKKECKAKLDKFLGIIDREVM